MSKKEYIKILEKDVDFWRSCYFKKDPIIAVIEGLGDNFVSLNKEKDEKYSITIKSPYVKGKMLKTRPQKIEDLLNYFSLGFINTLEGEIE